MTEHHADKSWIMTCCRRCIYNKDVSAGATGMSVVSRMHSAFLSTKINASQSGDHSVTEYGHMPSTLKASFFPERQRHKDRGAEGLAAPRSRRSVKRRLLCAAGRFQFVHDLV